MVFMFNLQDESLEHITGFGLLISGQYVICQKRRL